MRVSTLHCGTGTGTDGTGLAEPNEAHRKTLTEKAKSLKVTRLAMLLNHTLSVN